MRHLNKHTDSSNDLFFHLSRALVHKYNNRTDKKARYRPQNKDKKPLGEPTIRKLNRQEREKLKQINQKAAA